MPLRSIPAGDGRVGGVRMALRAVIFDLFGIGVRSFSYERFSESLRGMAEAVLAGKPSIRALP